ncbi:MAG: PqqD family protein [Spirochaetaceae bacterium]|nr:PqqD family protein [Spirochaetaceae bacterium]
MELNEKFKIREDVISTELDGEIVLMDVAKGEYYSLNEVGTLIWKTIGESVVSFNDICQAILDAFDIDRFTCEADVTKLLKQMKDTGIVEKVS